MKKIEMEGERSSEITNLKSNASETKISLLGGGEGGGWV